MRLILLLFCSILFQNLHAQTAQSLSAVMPDGRLLAVHDEAYLQNLQSHNPMLLLRWQYYLDHAFVIFDWPQEKGDILTLPVVRIADVNNINILALEQSQPLHRQWGKPVFFRINDSQKVLMYHPGRAFNRDFQIWLQSR